MWKPSDRTPRLGETPPSGASRELARLWCLFILRRAHRTAFDRRSCPNVVTDCVSCGVEVSLGIAQKKCFVLAWHEDAYATERRNSQRLFVFADMKPFGCEDTEQKAELGVVESLWLFVPAAQVVEG